VEPFLYDVEDILHCVGKNERTFVRNTRLHWRESTILILRSTMKNDNSTSTA
jgi:hypothetical protein